MLLNTRRYLKRTRVTFGLKTTRSIKSGIKDKDLNDVGFICFAFSGVLNRVFFFFIVT